MADGKRSESLLFAEDGIPPIGEAFPMAVQHVVAMIVGCVTPPIMVAGAAHLPPEETVLLVQGSLVMSAVATFLQLFPLGKRLGSGLPVVLGVSFAYVTSMVAIVEGYDLASVFGAELVGGLVAFLVGLNVRRLRKLFPPLITGTVVFTIGLSLYPTAINYMAGGAGRPGFGSWQNWTVAFFTLAVTTLLSHRARGLLRLASILVGIIAGYLFSIPFGLVDVSAVGEAGFFSLPRLLPFGIRFELSSCISIGLLFAINSVQAIGDFTATTTGAMDREPTDEELKGGIMCYGAANVLGSLFGGLPTATYSQNVGIVTTTRVVNRATLGLAAGIILLAGLCPKLSALLATIPYSVLGGATVSVFASIAMTGMRLVTSGGMDWRSSSIVGLAAALGMGLSMSPQALGTLPGWFVIIFGKSPVIIATLVAVFLNLTLPKTQDKGSAPGKKGEKGDG